MDSTKKSEAITDDTASLDIIESASLTEVDIDTEPTVYGLEQGEQAEAVIDRHKTAGLAIGGLVGAGLLVGTLVALPSLQSSPASTEPVAEEPAVATQDESASVDTDATADKPATEAPKATVKKKATGSTSKSNDAIPELPDPLSQDELEERMQQLVFDGQNVSVTAGDSASISSMGSRLVVTHTVSETADISPWNLTDLEVQRAAAFASTLGNTAVQNEDEDTPYLLSDITWVTSDEDDEVFMAFSFPAGNAPTSGTTADVLAGAKGYVISNGLYHALGRETCGYPQSAGETPQDKRGEQIEPTAYLSKYGTGE